MELVVADLLRSMTPGIFSMHSCHNSSVVLWVIGAAYSGLFSASNDSQVFGPSGSSKPNA